MLSTADGPPRARLPTVGSRQLRGNCLVTDAAGTGRGVRGTRCTADANVYSPHAAAGLERYEPTFVGSRLLLRR